MRSKAAYHVGRQVTVLRVHEQPKSDEPTDLLTNLFQREQSGPSLPSMLAKIVTAVRRTSGAVIHNRTVLSGGVWRS
jgi:exoribonuclease R